MKKYQSPKISSQQPEGGLPTVLAIGAIAAATSAAAVGVSKLIGDDRTGRKGLNLRKIEE